MFKSNVLNSSATNLATVLTIAAIVYVVLMAPMAYACGTVVLNTSNAYANTLAVSGGTFTVFLFIASLFWLAYSGLRTGSKSFLLLLQFVAIFLREKHSADAEEFKRNQSWFGASREALAERSLESRISPAAAV